MKFKNAQLKQLAARIDALTYRERIILAVTLAVAIVFVSDWLLLASQLDGRKTLQTELATAETELATASAMQTQLEATLGSDPNAQEQIRLERYTREIERIDEILKSKTLEFVTPQQMVEVLKMLIDKDPGLKLTRLESTGPDFPLQQQAMEENSATPKTELGSPNVFVHGLELSFSGDYFSALRYVEQLEALQWRFAWASMTLRLEKYPNAEVQIRLETLSLTEGWIGV